MRINAWHHAITIIVSYNLLAPLLACSGVLFELVQEDSQNVALFKTLTKMYSQTGCLLVCCTDTECQVASFDNKKMICNLYKSSEDAFLFPGDVSFYRKVHCKTDLMRDVRSRGETYSKADTIGTKNLSVSLTYLVCFTLLVKK